MFNQVEIEPYYDVISVGNKLDSILDGFDIKEIHLFAYFSAFLYHYSGNPVGDWKYKFIIDDEGFPHSKKINDAVESHLKTGSFEYRDNFIVITGRGVGQFNNLSKLDSMQLREKFLDAACNTSILIPYKETKDALLHDSNLVKAKKRGNEEWIDIEYENLREVTKALGASIDDLTLSAIMWIRYLMSN